MTDIGPGSFPPDDEDGPGRDDEDGLGRDENSFSLGADGDDLDDLESAEDYDDEIAATFHPIPGGASCRFAHTLHRGKEQRNENRSARRIAK